MIGHRPHDAGVEGSSPSLPTEIPRIFSGLVFPGVGLPPDLLPNRLSGGNSSRASGGLSSLDTNTGVDQGAKGGRGL
jgi:hypothetical protein